MQKTDSIFHRSFSDVVADIEKLTDIDIKAIGYSDAEMLIEKLRALEDELKIKCIEFSEDVYEKRLYIRYHNFDSKAKQIHRLHWG